MQSRYSRLFQILLLLGDLLLLNLCFLLALSLRFEEANLQATEYYDYYIQLLIFFNISWLFLTFVFRTFETSRNLEPRKATSRMLNVYFLHIFLLLLVMVSLKKDVYSRLFLIYFYSSLLLTIIPWRFFFLRLLRTYRRRGYNFRRIVLIGNGRGLSNFYQAVNKHPEYGLRFSAYYAAGQPQPDIPFAGDENTLERLWESGEDLPDEIYCSFPPGDERLLRWFRLADQYLVRFRVVPDLGMRRGQGIDIDYFHDIPILLHRTEPLEYLQNRWLKRGFDIVFSLLVLLLCAPFFPLLALGIKVSSPGPVFFRQKRTGLQQRDFEIYKFRSMRINREAHLQQAVKGDKRITAFGHFLRKYKIDELPQFWNVLKGDMSVVGPRPHMLSHTEEYRQLIGSYMVRHLAKPGITGLAQVHGFHGEVQKPYDLEERVRLDVYYIENWSVLLDVKIILWTIWITLSGWQGKSPPAPPPNQ